MIKNRLWLTFAFLISSVFFAHGKEAISYKNIILFQRTFFNGHDFVLKSSQPINLINSDGTTHSVSIDNAKVRVSQKRDYAIAFDKIGLNFYKRNNKIIIGRTEPDSSIDLYRINKDKLYYHINLAQFGSSGVIYDAYWSNADTVILLSIISEEGVMYEYNFKNNIRKEFLIDKKYNSRANLNNKICSIYYRQIYNKDWQKLFTEMESDYFQEE